MGLVWRIVDYEVQTSVIGWPRDLGMLQAGGWDVPHYSTDLNAAADIYSAMRARGRTVYERFLALLPEGIPKPSHVALAALNVIGHES